MLYEVITLGSQGFRFSEGKLTLLGPDETTDHLASFLWKNWQAVEVRDTWPAVQRLDVRYATPDDIESLLMQDNPRRVVLILSDGKDATPQPVAEIGTRSADTRLKDAILGLDPFDDADWTAKGLPRITSYNVCYTKLLRTLTKAWRIASKERQKSTAPTSSPSCFNGKAKRNPG